MEDVVYDLFSTVCGGINTKGKQQLGTFAICARNTRTGNWAFGLRGGASMEWHRKYESDNAFIFDRANDSLFKHEPLKIGDIVVERDINLQEHWPECWWHEYIQEHPEVKQHLLRPDSVTFSTTVEQTFIPPKMQSVIKTC